MRITGVSALVTLVRVLMVGAKLMLLIGEATIKFEAYRVLVHPTVEVNARVANNNLLKMFMVSSFYLCNLFKGEKVFRMHLLCL